MFTWLTKPRLQVRISLLVALGLTLIFAFMAWEGRQIADANRQMVLQERLTVARVVAQHLDQDLERTLSRLKQAAASPAINLDAPRGDLEPEKAELRALYRPDYFSYVFLLDKDGLVLWTEPYLPDVVNREHLECPHVQETLRTGQPAIACVPHALTPLSPVIAPVVPIRNRQGAIVGALGAAIDPSSPPFVSIFEGMAPGNTGYIQLVDENGIVLAHTERQHLFQKSDHADLLLPWLKEKRSAIATYTVTEAGKGTFREVIAFAPLTAAPWGVAVEQEEAEFLAPSLEASRRMELFAVIVVAATLLLAWVTTRSVLEPVRKLMAASERIAAGDLTTPVPPLGEDEIGELGRHFEEMRKRLARWGEELEAAVQRRNRELSTLYTIDRAAAQSLDLAEILDDSLDKVLETLQVEAGGIFLLEPDGKTMTLRVHRGLSDEFVAAVQHIRLGEGIPGRAAAEGKPVVLDVPDYPSERLAPHVVREGFQTLASTPLFSTGELVGALNLATRRPRAFPPEEIDLLTAIGRQLGGAVQNARLFKAQKHRAEEMTTLVEMNRAITEGIGLKETLDRIVNSARKIIPVSECSVSLVDELNGDMVVQASTNGEIGVRISPTVPSAVGWVAKTKQLLAEADVSTNPIFNQELNQRYGIQSAMAVPIIYKGKGIGALGLSVCHARRAFSDGEKIMAQAIADQAAIAIENARLYEETRARAERLAVLNRIARALSTTLNLDELLQIVHREIAPVIQSDAFFIALYDCAANELDFRIRVDKGIREPLERRPLTAGLTASIITNKQPILIRDFEKEKEHLPPAKLWGTMQAPPSWLGVPMLRGENVVGVISVQAYHPNAYDAAEQELLSTIADAVAVAIENARLYEAEQRRAARLDALQRLSIELATLREERAVLNTLVARTATIAESPACTVMLVDEAMNEAVLAAQTGLPEGAPPELRVPLTLPIIRHSLETGEPIILSDINHDAPAMRAILVRPDIRAFFAYPMVREGRTLGFITLSSLTPRTPSAQEITAYCLLAERAAAALENARLYQRVVSSEQGYRTLVENATELIWTHDTEGRFTFVNKVGEQVSGHRLQDWLGKSFAPLIAPPEDLPRIQQIVRETLGGKSSSYAVGVYRADGSIIYLSVNTAPLYRDGKVIGTISFGRDVTAQREAESAAQQRMTELTALFEVSGALREAKTLDEMLPIILRSTVQVMRCDQGLLSLVDRERGEVVVRVTTPGQASLLGTRTKIGEGVSGRVVQTRHAMLPADFADLRAPEFVRRLVHEPRAVICYPLKTGVEVVGTIYLSAPLPHEFSESDLKLLTAIADMAANAIHRATLFEQLEHRVQELSALFDVGKMVTASLRIEDVVEFIVNAVTRTVRAEGGALFLWDEREERLVMRAVVGAPPELVGRVKYRSGEGLVGWVFLERRPANVSNAAADPRWKIEPEQENALPGGRINSALIVPLTVGEKILGTLSAANKTGAPAFTESDESLLTALAGQMAIAIENARLYEGVRGLSTATIRSLATAIDARDPYTRGHSEEVTRLAVQVARELGWSGADLEMLEFAALLHDVGKIAVPDAILRKAEPLTPDEWNIIRMHPYHSAQIVKPVEPLNRLVPWIYHHQEKWDGTGYPDGLKGEAIPLAARIIAVVDAFNAMTTDRPYRRAKTRSQAIEELERCAGTQFDPQIVQAFVRVVDIAKNNG